MTDSLDFDHINTELLMVGKIMRECLDDFVNLRTTCEEFDEMMSSYANQIDTARHQHDVVLPKKINFTQMEKYNISDSFSLKAMQTPDTKKLSKAGITMYQWYEDVLVKLKQ